jgi:hypothetical protein
MHLLGRMRVSVCVVLLANLARAAVSVFHVSQTCGFEEANIQFASTSYHSFKFERQILSGKARTW